MTPSDDIESLAAEYALGALDPAERAQVAARRLVDPDLDRAVREWEERLAPLAETIPELTPPPSLFDRIERRIAAPDAPEPAATQELLRRLRRWRMGTWVAGALAACLALALGLRETARPPGAYVALLETKTASAGFLLTLDAASRTLSVRPVGAPAQLGKSYELWLVAPASAPRSWGVLNAAQPSVKPVQGSVAAAETADWAVSIEPEGGSSTGKPTGPVVFEGRFSPIKS